ncbi:hypothetical protein J31TS4_37890 [Paenibacillus sp. J31TS4]|uniref:hypothetical protein n=1 Tax=Paenibacillus sp. J31TS4 TaxID=2807195 RepID=UPI001B21C0A7|nr:hypothetical protein [Paenibacillus sp. J31TS4]GIP40509.1 hypothetical protein J31TS4_37890 [Paenibacillus sp. J31TS4]
MLLTSWLERFAPGIRKLPPGKLSKEELLDGRFLLREEGALQMHYAPHNDWLPDSAKLMLVGITPGWTQTETAYRIARDELQRGRSLEEAARAAKEGARYAGPMRRHLVAMLDELELDRALGLSTCEEAFAGCGGPLHTTSLLRHPVFVEGSNYNGHRPSLLGTDWLRETAVRSFEEEWRRLDGPYLIPLGQAVEQVLSLLAAEGRLDGSRCLWGFPHPSGSNGHRHRQFRERRDELRAAVRRAFR